MAKMVVRAYGKDDSGNLVRVREMTLVMELLRIEICYRLTNNKATHVQMMQKKKKLEAP